MFGDALEAAIALTFVGEGMPLIYNGQEAGNRKRLEFFEKDPIEWRQHPIGALYRELLVLQKSNTALWNGSWGAPMMRVPNDAMDKVISFVRQNDNDKVFAAFNFSDTAQEVSFAETLYHGEYTEFSTSEREVLNADSRIVIEPWGYRVYLRQ